MKFSIDVKQLADAVGWVAGALPRRPVSPALGGLLLEADQDGIEVSAFDYDTSRQIRAAADVGEPGRVLLPGRVLVELAKVLPAGKADIEADAQEAAIRAGRSEFALPLMDIRDYPTLPAVVDGVGQLEAGGLAAAVSQVAVAAGKDDTLPMLTCVRFEVGDAGLTLAATDRYRVAWRGVAWASTLDATEVQAMVPAVFLQDLVKGFPAGAQVEVGLGQSLASFSCEDRRATIRLHDPEFISFRKFEQIDVVSTLTVDTAALVKAVKRVGLMLERSMPIRLSLDQTGVLVEAGNTDVGRASELVDARLEGPDMQVAFNTQFLVEGLQAAGREATMRLQSPTKAVLITGGEPSFRYVVIPVRLAS